MPGPHDEAQVADAVFAAYLDREAELDADLDRQAEIDEAAEADPFGPF